MMPAPSQGHPRGGQGPPLRSATHRVLTIGREVSNTPCRVLILQGRVPDRQGAELTHQALASGLKALIPSIANLSPALGDCAPFAVSRDGSGIFHSSRHGTVIKLRVVIRPEAELAFRTLIDAEDRLPLPLPYGGLVKATWLHERKVGLRIFDVPEGMLPSYLKLGLEEAHETVLSCDWDVPHRLAPISGGLRHASVDKPAHRHQIPERIGDEVPHHCVGYTCACSYTPPA